MHNQNCASWDWYRRRVSTNDPLDLDRQICFPLYAATRAVTRRYTEVLADVGLTYPQYLVMLALWTDGPLSVGELGRRLRLDSGTLTPLLKRLEASGRVERRRDPHDERRVVVTPTAQGERLRRDVAGVPARGRPVDRLRRRGVRPAAAPAQRPDREPRRRRAAGMSAGPAVGRHRDLVARLPARLRRRGHHREPARRGRPRAAAGSPPGSTTCSTWAATGCCWGRSSTPRPTATTPSTTCASTRGWATTPTPTRCSRACRERGIRVLLDGVFNHVGRAHPWWQEAVAAGPGLAGSRAVRDRRRAPARSTASRCRCSRATRASSCSNHEQPRGRGGRHRRHGALAGARRRRLAPRRRLRRAARRSGAPRIEPLRERFPDAWFVGEVIHGDYVGYVEESGLDSVTQYELWKAIRSSIEERNWFELAWSLQRHDEFAAAFLPADLRRQPRRDPAGVGDHRPAPRRPRRRRAVLRRRHTRPSTPATSAG